MDLAAAQAQHDAIAKGGQPGANMLGDFSHRVGLGTTILGTTSDQFFALDRWHENNLDKVYDDPMFQQAFGSLFAAPPSLDKLVRNTTWVTWGDIVSADAKDPHYYVVVRGVLKDPKTAQPIHDKAASGGKDASMMAGDVAHIVFQGRDDEAITVFLDVWTAPDAIMTVYSNPAFKDTFDALFTSPPSFGVYQSSAWYQW
jgi:hypothetical protein